MCFPAKNFAGYLRDGYCFAAVPIGMQSLAALQTGRCCLAPVSVQKYSVVRYFAVYRYFSRPREVLPRISPYVLHQLMQEMDFRQLCLLGYL